MFSVSSLILLHSFEQVEQQTLHRNLERTLDTLSHDFTALETTVGDYATWDDTYAFLENGDLEYIKLNLNKSTFTTFNLHLILLTQTSGQVVFSERRDPISQQIAPLPQVLQDQVIRSSVLQPSTLKKQRSGIVLLPDGPMFVASRPVLTSKLEGPARGTLLMGRYLNAAELKRWSELTRLSLSLQQVADSRLPSDFESARAALLSGQTFFVQPLSRDAIAGYVLLEDIQGHPALLLRAEMSREIHHQGLFSLRYLGISLLSLAALFGLVIWLLWRRLVCNIVERDRIEHALFQEERFRKVFEDAPIGMAIANINTGQLVKANHVLCQMLGYTSVELEIKTLQEIMHSDHWSHRHWVDQLEKGAIASYQIEKRCLKQNQETLWVNFTATLIHDPQGMICHILGMFENVTERKQTEATLRQSEAQSRNQAEQLRQTLAELQQTQAQLIQSEKMSSLGQLVAGIAHEINNPVNFIHGNLVHVDSLTQDLLSLIKLYQKHYPQPSTEILTQTEAADLDFLGEDLPKLFSSMKVGSERIRQLIQSLCNFSRLNEADIKAVNIHEGIDSTLVLLHNRLQARETRLEIQVTKEYTDMPLVECYAKQLNQVFMNILLNAIEAIDRDAQRKTAENEWLAEEERSPHIWIQTLLKDGWATVKIADNGAGFSEQVKARIFDPFFTTKAIGEGTGLGLSVSYQVIVGNHHGQLQCCSTPGQGAEFTIQIPLQRQLPQCRTRISGRH